MVDIPASLYSVGASLLFDSKFRPYQNLALYGLAASPPTYVEMARELNPADRWGRPTLEEWAQMRYQPVFRCLLLCALLVLLSVIATAQTVKIQGQDLPYRLVDGRQMISRALMAQAFPGFSGGEGEVDLSELLTDPEARVVKRDGVIVSVRYYDSAMAAFYQANRQPARHSTPSAPAVAEGEYQSVIAEVVRLSNIERQNHGASALMVDQYLEIAALGHSLEMAKLNYFQHTSPTPGRETPDLRIKLAGSAATKSGENLAMFGGTPEAELAEQAVTGWINSPGHRLNLLDPGFTHIGIGIARNADGQIYITQNFCTY